MLVKIYTENPSEKEIDRVVNLLERDTNLRWEPINMT